MTLRVLAILVASWLLAGVVSSAEEEITQVLAEGDTVVSLAKPKPAVVRIRVRKVQQGTSASSDAALLVKDCPTDRGLCSLVEDIHIEVNKTSLFVPRSSFRGLSNLHVAGLTVNRGVFHLVLRGGDGSEGYVATIIFDENRVSGRRLTSSLALNDVLEETVYRRQRDSFDR